MYQVSNRFELRKQCILSLHGNRILVLTASDIATLIWAHTDEIRELAFNPSDVSKFAAGGTCCDCGPALRVP